MGKPQIKDVTEDRLLMERRRKRLDGYSTAVNTPIGQSGFTPHEVIGKLSRFEELDAGTAWPLLSGGVVASCGRREFLLLQEFVAELQESVSAIGKPREHIFWESTRTSFLPDGTIEDLDGTPERRRCAPQAPWIGRDPTEIRAIGRSGAGPGEGGKTDPHGFACHRTSGPHERRSSPSRLEVPARRDSRKPPGNYSRFPRFGPDTSPSLFLKPGTRTSGVTAGL